MLLLEIDEESVEDLLVVPLKRVIDADDSLPHIYHREDPVIPALMDRNEHHLLLEDVHFPHPLCTAPAAFLVT